ncbi:MAG: epoxyqueuosine reductase [Deltaproteobacteria bacterium]|nr:epoxyqueuosine reductase [Deltaproteobacteria bacterium]
MPGMRSFPEFTRIDLLLRKHGIAQWGVADNDPPLHLSPRLPRAIALLAGFQTKSLADIENGPTEAYFIEYKRLNALLNKAAAALVRHLEKSGHSASLVEATLEEYDQVEDWGNAGVFAHKTAATQAGLGWIGKTALFVSSVLGPRVRLATVFTDLDLPPGTPITNGRCGHCRLCIDACPVGAGRDVQWKAGIERDHIYDEKACEHFGDNFPELGGVCGICIAACRVGNGLRLSGNSKHLLSADKNFPERV